MRGKRTPPNEPVTARMRVDRRGRLATGRVLNCGRCGQRLPTLVYLRFHNEFDRQAQHENGGLGPNDLYIDWRQMPGWAFDGATLRPTHEHRERFQRTHKDVLTNPRAETRPARLKLAGRAPHGRGLVPSEERQRQGGLVGFPTKRPAPQRIECLQCGVENRIELTPQSGTE